MLQRAAIHGAPSFRLTRGGVSVAGGTDSGWHFLANPASRKLAQLNHTRVISCPSPARWGIALVEEVHHAPAAGRGLHGRGLSARYKVPGHSSCTGTAGPGVGSPARALAPAKALRSTSSAWLPPRPPPPAPSPTPIAPPPHPLTQPPPPR